MTSIEAPALRGHPTLGNLADRGTFSWAEVFAVRETQTTFAAVAAFQNYQATVTGDGRPEVVTGAVATHELFTIAGAVPVAGRLFTESDEVPGSEPVALLNEGYWQDRYGGDPAIIGTSIVVNGRARTIVGVLPASFRVRTFRARLWSPVADITRGVNWGNHSVTGALGRLAPGVSIEQAQADLTSILRSAPSDHIDAHEAAVYPRLSDETRNVKRPLSILIGASILLLIVAYGNVAAILLSQGIDRRQELAVRAAIGATRGRIVRQMVTESSMLALIGAAGGALVTMGAMRSLLSMAPGGVPRLDHTALDLPALAFAVAGH